jgi:hypothetical protein
MPWIIPVASMALSYFGSKKQGDAQQKNTDAQMALQDKGLSMNAEMGRANFNRQNPATMMGNSARGDVLANAQPASFTGSGRDLKRHGGLGPQLFSDNTRQLGSQVSRQALLAMLGQAQDPGVQDPYASPTFPGEEKAVPRTRKVF